MAELQPHTVSREYREMGVENVRKVLQSGGGTPEWLALAKQWLSHHDQETSVAFQAQGLETAKSATGAAWEAANAARDAAREAKTANMIATLALIVAVIAIAASVIAIFLR